MTDSATGATQRAILPSSNPNWLVLQQEEILEPALPIVDPHHHLWDEPRVRYMAEEFAADLGAGHNVVATVFADCTEGYRKDGPENMRPVGETETMTRVGEESDAGRYGGKTRINAGIISYADLREGAGVENVLRAHIEAGRGRFKGIRQSTSWDPDPSVRSTLRTPPEKLLLDPTLREGFACLEKLGLVFDSWVYHHQLSDVADLARSFPGASIVLDHCGGPLGIGPYGGKRDEVFAIWKKGIAEIARHPNVTVKIGGLAMRISGFGFHERPKPPSSEDLAGAWRPYVETCIEAFGASRCMFESNFPVDQLSCSYAVLWNAFKRLAAGASADEKADLFSRTATRVYSLTL